MARTERNSVDYFPFMCKEGKVLFYIENKYGNDGFATWVKILRQLAVTNFHYLDLSSDMELMFLASKCRISESAIESIVKDLVMMGEFDKVLWAENKIIWCQKLTDSVKDAYIKRNNNCISYEALLHLLEAKGIRKLSKSIPKGGGNTQTKEEKTKVKKSKEVKGEFSPPTIDEVIEYFVQEGYTEESGKKAWKHYELGAWKDTNGKQVLSWKQKMHAVWFKPENVSQKTIEAKKELGIKPNGFPNPQVYYATCWEKKITPVRWENGDTLSESEIEQQHKLHKVGQYQYA